MSVNKLAIEELYNTIENYGLMPVIKGLLGAGTKIQIPFTHFSCETDVTALNLSVRSTNCLMRAGLKTVEQVIDAIHENSLLKIRNLGHNSRAEIRVRVCEFGYAQLSDNGRKNFISTLLDLNKNKIS